MFTPRICLLAFWVLLAAPFLRAAEEAARSLAQERREVDELLASADSVELRKISPRVLALAEALWTTSKDVVARRYFERGLEGNAWALKDQLLYGEVLVAAGEPNALREKAEMVWRVGEEESVLRRAGEILGRPAPPEPPPFAPPAGPAPELILVPVAEISPFVLQDLGDSLGKALGLKVSLASVPLQLPEADRTARKQWVARTRPNVLAAVEKEPLLAVKLGGLGFTLLQIRADDEAFVAMIRKTTELEQGKEALQKLDAMLAQLDATQQWDIARLLEPMNARLGAYIGPHVLVLGVTSRDLYGGNSNYLFGAAAPRGALGLVSTHRFTAEFNVEAPKRERLNQRVFKQAMSTFGFMLGVPRCQTPECVRAFPQSLAEHDQKPTTLCGPCREAFEKVLGQKLPAP